MTTCIILPVSRPTHLPAIFACLELLNCDRGRTSLLVMVDGDAELFVQARNFTESSKFKQRLCIQRKPDGSKFRYSLQHRRVRIGQIHQELKQHIPACDYVLSLEDDSIPPINALRKLTSLYALYPFAGFVSGVELGRHGITHVGAWTADDVYEPTVVTSLMPDRSKQVREVDAAGLYCALIKAEHYMKHDFTHFDAAAFGPDIAFGIALRQTGYQNYCDFAVPVEHRRDDGSSMTMANIQIQQVELKLQSGTWVHQVL